MAGQRERELVLDEVCMDDDNRENCEGIAILQRDLDILAAVIMHRFTARAAEDHRLVRIRGMLTRSSELLRALELQTRYALVDHRGSHGSHDLGAATQALFNVLQDYAAALRDLGEEYAEFAVQKVDHV